MIAAIDAGGAATEEDVMAEYVIQRIGSEVPGVKVPRWFGGFATLTMPRWTGDRAEAMRFPDRTRRKGHARTHRPRGGSVPGRDGRMIAILAARR
jgi:hypothetical protein